MFVPRTRLPAALLVLAVAAIARADDSGPSIVSVRSTLSPRFGPSARSGSGSVGLYEKFELHVDLKASYTNPYDPDQIDLWAEFTSPSGKPWRVCGFYNPSSWSSLWMVRFAPTETGTWNYVVKVKDCNGVAEGGRGRFEAAPSAHHGFVTIAPNARYLRYSDGASFYGVGIWYNDEYHGPDTGNVTAAGLDELKRCGANFVCFFPTPLETMGTGLGRYDQDLAARLDQLFQWCDEREMHVGWNLWFHSWISQTVWGERNTRYRNNPYRSVTEAADFFKSDEAWKWQEKLYRYIIARWGYSRALMLWFVVDEINGTEGWGEGDHAVAEQWCRKVHQFLHEHDPYSRPTTGTQSGGIKEWWAGGYQIFDIPARELYEIQGHPMLKSGKPDPEGSNPLQLSYKNYATQTQKLWRNFAKPAMFGECGWDHTYYEPGMPEYLAMYHNALWASLANGLSASPIWWAYSDRLNDSLLTNQLLYFSRFAAELDCGNLAAPEPAEITAGECDAWAIKSKKLIFGWLANPRTSVANESFTISGLPDGKYSVRLYRTWNGSFLPEQVVDCRDGQLTASVPELRPTDSHALHIGHDVAFRISPQ